MGICEKNKPTYCKIKQLVAFTLAEVLIVVGMIGIIAELTIPTVVQNVQESQIVAGLLKFNSTLNQAIQMWKQESGCYSDAYTCLGMSGFVDDSCASFEQISKYMKINSKEDLKAYAMNNLSWLPYQTLNYYGEAQNGVFGGVSQSGVWQCAYSLIDGQNIAVDVNPTSLSVIVDVNGIKPPNRIGKDTFHFTVGGIRGKDIYYYPTNSNLNFKGLCPYSVACDPSNTDPTKNNGASPTSYVILNKKLPDFAELSKTVTGFRP